MSLYFTYLANLTFQLICFWASHWILETAQSNSGKGEKKKRIEIYD